MTTKLHKNLTINAGLTHPQAVLSLILTITVMLRLAYILIFGYTLNLQLSGYDIYARNLVAGNGYSRFADLHPDSDLPPLYPFVLAAIYATLGRSAINVAVVQIAFDVVTLIAIYAIGRRVGGEVTGLLAAAFTGFYPYLLFQNLSVNDTGVFIMLLALGIWAAYQVREHPTWGRAIALGVIFGLAALTKTLVVLLLPMLVLWWWRSIDFRRAVILGAAMLMGFVAAITPWVIRNTRLQGTFTLISTNDGSNLYQANNPCITDYLLSGWDAQWVNCLDPKPTGLTEAQDAAWYREKAFTYLRDHIGEWPRLFAIKFAALWSPDVTPRAVPPNANLGDSAVLQYEQPLFKVARVIHLIYFTPLLILGIGGLWLGWRNRRLIGPIVAILITITVTYLIYHPSTRYRSPADPFVFVLAGYAVTELWRYLSIARHAT